jgi:hypothetical protein
VKPFKDNIKLSAQYLGIIFGHFSLSRFFSSSFFISFFSSHDFSENPEHKRKRGENRERESEEEE